MSASATSFRLVVLVALVMTGVQARAQVPAAPPAADSARLAAARQLLAATGSVDAMLSATKASLPALQQASPQLPPEFWNRFRDTLTLAAPALLDSIAVMYANLFTLEELREVAAFYQTPVGRRLRDLQPRIIAESSAMGQRWGARIGAAIGASLTKD